MNSIKKTVAVASLGGIIEMYDFVIYIFLSSLIGHTFFPHDDPSVQLLLTLGIFAIGYLSRPIGGILIGHFTDRYGRRQGLMVSVLLMAISVLLVGIMPSYASIGIAAPILLLICRILQGLSVGGEFPSAVTFLAEHSSAKRRGFVCSWLFCGVNLGIVLGSGFVALLLWCLPHSAMQSWGWRVPFILGSVLAVVGFYIRTRMQETDAFVQARSAQQLVKVPLASVLKTDGVRLVQGVLLVCLMATTVSVVFLAMPHYLVKHSHLAVVGPLTLSKAMWMNTINVLVFALLIPLFGALSDGLGRKKVVIAGAVLTLLLSVWLFTQLRDPGLISLWSGLLLNAVLGALIIGPITSMLAELFPTASRTTGVAIAYNISFGVFGGLAPFAVVSLEGAFHSANAPAYYLMIAAAITLIAGLWVKESVGKSLN